MMCGRINPGWALLRQAPQRIEKEVKGPAGPGILSLALYFPYSQS